MNDALLDFFRSSDPSNHELGVILLQQQLGEQDIETWVREQFSFDFFDAHLPYSNYGKTWKEKLVCLFQQKKLSFDKLNIREIPACIGQLTNLKEINLLHNPLLDLDQVFRVLAPLAQQKYVIWTRVSGDLMGAPEHDSYLILRIRKCVHQLPESIGLLRRLRWLDLSCGHLERLPEALWSLPELRLLNLSFNKLRSLPDRFDALPSLEQLCLEGNFLFQLPESIGRLPNLTHLQLQYHRKLQVPCISVLQQQSRPIELTEYYAPSFFYWPSFLAERSSKIALQVCGDERYECVRKQINPQKIERWQLKSNGVDDLPSSYFAQFTSLKSLSIHPESPHTTVPINLFAVPNLRRLNIGGEQITAIPDEIGQLHTLKELDLYSDKLTQLPASIEQLRGLEALKCYCPLLFSNWKSLNNKLEPKLLNFNALKAYPISFGDYFSTIRLEVFSITGAAEIEPMPPDLLNFLEHAPQLKQINLISLKLTEFPKILCTCSQLEKISIWAADFPSIPDEIGQLTQLKELSLRNCNLPDSPALRQRLQRLLPTNCTLNL